MFTIPIVLLAVLLVVVFVANSVRKKGQLSESAYQTVLSVASILVTVGALLILFLRLRGR